MQTWQAGSLPHFGSCQYFSSLPVPVGSGLATRRGPSPARPFPPRRSTAASGGGRAARREGAGFRGAPPVPKPDSTGTGPVGQSPRQKCTTSKPLGSIPNPQEFSRWVTQPRLQSRNFGFELTPATLQPRMVLNQILQLQPRAFRIRRVTERLVLLQRFATALVDSLLVRGQSLPPSQLRKSDATKPRKSIYPRFAPPRDFRKRNAQPLSFYTSDGRC